MTSLNVLLAVDDLLDLGFVSVVIGLDLALVLLLSDLPSLFFAMFILTLIYSFSAIIYLYSSYSCYFYSISIWSLLHSSIVLFTVIPLSPLTSDLILCLIPDMINIFRNFSYLKFSKSNSSQTIELSFILSFCLYNFHSSLMWKLLIEILKFLLS